MQAFPAGRSTPSTRHSPSRRCSISASPSPCAILTLGDIKVVGQPINLTKAPQPAEYRPTPELGQHTDEIMAGLGHDAKAIAGFAVARRDLANS